MGAARAASPGRTQTQRLDLRHRDGSLRPFEVSSVAVVRDGEVENVYGIARDVAERERLERELRESEERYRFLVENSPDVIYATDAEGVITYFSESVERSLGWTPPEVVGRHFRDIVRTTTPGRPSGRRFARARRRAMPDLTTRMELLDKDGEFRPFEVTAAAMRIDGVFSGVHGSARDIRERERLERELRDSEERYRYLVQSSPDLVWMTDADGRFTFVSDQARADPRLGAAGAPRALVRRPEPRTTAGAARSPGSAGSSAGPPRRTGRASTSWRATGASWRWRSPGIGMVGATGSSWARTAPPATCPTASGWSAGCAARPRSSPRPRSGPTSPASSTTP